MGDYGMKPVGKNGGMPEERRVMEVKCANGNGGIYSADNIKAQDKMLSEQDKALKSGKKHY